MNNATFARGALICVMEEIQMLTMSEISSHFSHVHWNGPTHFVCCCPAHHDRNPSMQVRERDGRIYIKCFAGCDIKDILKAAGLSWSDIRESRPYVVDCDPMPFSDSQLALLGLQTSVEKKIVGFCQTRQEIPQGLYSVYDPDGYAISKEFRYSVKSLWADDKDLFHQIVVGKLCSIYKSYCEMYNNRYYRNVATTTIYESGIKHALEDAIRTLNPVFYWYVEHQDILTKALKDLSGLYGNADFHIPNSILSAVPIPGDASTEIERFNQDMHNQTAFAKIPKVSWTQDKKRYAIT